jgi:uncharacterized protein (UPF0210 family)
VKVRAVTLGVELPVPDVVAAPFERAAAFLRDAGRAFADAGVDVQTRRLAGPDLSLQLGTIVDGPGFRGWAAESERVARDSGIDYLSLGRLPATATRLVERELASTLAEGEIGFLSADLIEGQLPSVPMANACARAVLDLARGTPLGFGNLRFAATAHCPPNIPFLPAAYHGGGPERFSVAVQAADIVVDAFAEEGGLSRIEDRLVLGLETAMAPLERVADRLAQSSGFAFVGIDLSPAPFPTDEVSIGGAIERAGVDRFGAPGTLAVGAMITRAIRRTRVRRCGFSGLMLPLLEDSVLARRAREHAFSLHELLLYSAVCGTGLDTIPLPADVSEEELAGTYLDVAALSLALGNKPLTARLLPVPGARAGDRTEYTFDYFSNSRVLAVTGAGAGGLVRRGR